MILHMEQRVFTFHFGSTSGTYAIAHKKRWGCDTNCACALGFKVQEQPQHMGTQDKRIHNDLCIFKTC